MRLKFQEELEVMLNMVRVMGVELEETLDSCIDNIKKQDIELANSIIARDDYFDNEERTIEQLCLNLLLRQTPVAKDLREIASCLKLVGDLERIADHCSDFSTYTLRLSEKKDIELPPCFFLMLQAMRGMVYDSITAISEMDATLARKVIVQDDVVDSYFSEIRNKLTIMMQEKPNEVPQCVDYLMISKYAERVADHATNIAEWVLYIEKNELK